MHVLNKRILRTKKSLRHFSKINIYKCLLLSGTFIYNIRFRQMTKKFVTIWPVSRWNFYPDCDETSLPFGSHVRSRTCDIHPRNLRALTTGIILPSLTALWAKPLSVSRPCRLGSLRADLQHWWGRRGNQRATWMCVGTSSAREIAAEGSVSCNVESS